MIKIRLSDTKKPIYLDLKISLVQSFFPKIWMVKVLILSQIFNAKVENIHHYISALAKMLKNQKKFHRKKCKLTKILSSS